jgi:tRNA(fMet)-specific endonuclease VapC
VNYVLDTDHISIIQECAGPEYTILAARLGKLLPSDYAFTAISFHEQVLGANSFINRARSSSDVVRGYFTLAEALQTFCQATVLPFDAGPAAVFDGLRIQRVRIGTMDLRIAAIALSRGLVLLTRNIIDFSRVPGLVTEDWTQ